MTILNLASVAFTIPSLRRPILEDINYQVESGDFVILLGGNGSGKSTLLKLLHRDYQATQGKIEFLDMPIHRLPQQEFSQQVAVLTQNPSDSLFPSLTIYENYLLVSKQTSKSKGFLAEYLLEFNPNLAKKLNVPVNQLSGGEKQALALAFCLLKPPSLLLLDEHTSALDPKTSEQIMQLTEKMLYKHHITCILTTHDLDIALRYGNRILMLQNGKMHHVFDRDEKIQLDKKTLTSKYA